MVSSYSAVGLAAALSVGGGHEGRGEEDGDAAIGVSAAAPPSPYTTVLASPNPRRGPHRCST